MSRRYSSHWSFQAFIKGRQPPKIAAYFDVYASYFFLMLKCFVFQGYSLTFDMGHSPKKSRCPRLRLLGRAECPNTIFAVSYNRQSVKRSLIGQIIRACHICQTGYRHFTCKKLIKFHHQSVRLCKIFRLADKIITGLFPFVSTFCFG